MPTTSTTDSTFAVTAIGSRTNSAGAAVTDLSAEEIRLAAQILEPGYIEPTDAFTVRQSSTPGMSVRVGSDTAKADVYVVEGTVAGQGNYIVRHDSTPVTVTVPAAHASLARVDEVYLIVADNTYDAGSRSLPRIGYRQGDNGGGNPGPDSSWKAYALLARITVAATVTSIVTANISDQRTATSIKTSLYQGDTDGFYYTQDQTDDLLDEKSDTDHGHDPLASAMVGTSSTRGHARYSSSSTQTIADHANVVVGFATADDTDTLVARSTQGAGHKFTLGAAGIWTIGATVRFNESIGVAGERRAEIVADNYGSTQTIAVDGDYTTGAAATCNPSYTGWFDSGDFFYVQAYHNADENLVVTGDVAYHNVQATLIRRTA